MPYTLEKNRPKSESAQWRCIQDVHMLAHNLSIPPLEIDRIFFMIGSGRFDDNGRINVSQEDRYHLALKFLNKPDL